MKNDDFHDWARFDEQLQREQRARRPGKGYGLPPTRIVGCYGFPKT
jgi:hypothetical protein